MKLMTLRAVAQIKLRVPWWEGADQCIESQLLPARIWLLRFRGVFIGGGLLGRGFDFVTLNIMH